MEEQKPDSGWAWPINSKKAHFFVNGRSLCGRWAFLGNADEGGADSPPTKNDCAACRKKLEARKALMEKTK